MQVFWLARAINELRAIRDHIAKDNPAAADRVAAHLYASAERLEALPLSAPEGEIAGTRELVVSRYPYLIVYRLRADRVEIVRVIHGKRNWRKALRG